MTWGNFYENKISGGAKPAPKDAVIVPASKGEFLEAWTPLSKVPFLYTAAAVDQSGVGREISGEVYMTLDFVFRSYRDGVRASSVYTDQKLLLPHTSYAKIPTNKCLRYIFHSPRVNAVAFNVSDSTPSDAPLPQPPFTYAIPFSAVVPGVLIPRLIGLVESDDPALQNGHSHSECAAKALAEDNVFVAYFHAEAAREQGEPIESFFFTLVDTLIGLGMIQSAADYVNWYQSSGKDDPRIHLYVSQLYSLTGQAETAIQIVDNFLDHPALSASAWREHGRALLVLGKTEDAVNSFEKSLGLEPSHVQTLMGHGIALRNQHYHSEDAVGLGRSKESLERICKLGKFHVPEALHHLGTIAIALQNWAEAERCCRESISHKVNPVSHRNLILALHAQNKMEEAKRQFGLLRASWPDEAAKVAHYFQS